MDTIKSDQDNKVVEVMNVEERFENPKAFTVRKCLLEDIYDMKVNTSKIYYRLNNPCTLPGIWASPIQGNGKLKAVGKNNGNEFMRSFWYGRSKSVVLSTQEMLDTLYVRV